MGAKARGRGGAERGDIDALRLYRFEEGERPVGALEHSVEGGGLHVAGQLRVGGGKCRAHACVVGLAERGDEGALETGSAGGGELLHDGREDRRVGAAQADEALRGGEAGGVVGSGVGDTGKERASEPGDLALERAGLVPLRGEREHAAAGPAREELGEGGGKFGRHRRRLFERLAKRVEDAALERIGAGGLGGERDHELGRSFRVVLLADTLRESRDERRERRGISAVQRGGDARGGILRGGSDGGRLLEVVIKLRPRSDDLFGESIGEFSRSKAAQCRKTHACV